MKPARYGPFPYVPITERPKLTWPGGARLALWVIPNLEFFGLDDPMPGVHNERIPRSKAKIPNVRAWAQRDYGNRVAVWRLMDVMTRYGIRGTAALNSDLCRFHPQIVEKAVALGWELMGHNQTNAVRLNEMEPAAEKEAIETTLADIEKASGRRPRGWLSSGLSETWDTLDYLHGAGVRYVADWTNDDQPYRMDVAGGKMISIPYSFEVNDAPMFYYNKTSTAEFEEIIRRQFDVLWREGAESGRVMAICLHPFIIGVPHRIDSLDRALAHICRHPGVWLATGEEIVDHSLASGAPL